MRSLMWLVLGAIVFTVGATTLQAPRPAQERLPDGFAVQQAGSVRDQRAVTREGRHLACEDRTTLDRLIAADSAARTRALGDPNPRCRLLDAGLLVDIVDRNAGRIRLELPGPGGVMLWTSVDVVKDVVR